MTTAATRRRRDVLAVIAALVILLLGACLWTWRMAQVDEERAQALAGLPPFPSRTSQPWRSVPGAAHHTPTQPLAPEAVRDALSSFALAPGDSVAVVQVNALINTPLFERLVACVPQLADLHDAGLGFDPLRDLDRVALVPGGVALSGTFDGKPVASRLAPDGAARSSYRGADVYEAPDGGCTAQLGTLVLLGAPGSCQALVDRAQSSPPAAPAGALESDVYVRTSLDPLRAHAGEVGGGVPGLEQAADALDSVTLRANIWQEVAVTVDGTPRQGKRQELEGLAAMARLTLGAAQNGAGEDARWQALMDQASVNTTPTGLQVDVAIPMEQLLEHLELCPRDGGTLAH